MKNKFIKIITKSIALAVVIAFFSTYFYVVWNYYDPVQKKFVEPIKKTSYLPFAYASPNLTDVIYPDETILCTDDDGLLRVKFKFSNDYTNCYSNSYSSFYYQTFNNLNGIGTSPYSSFSGTRWKPITPFNPADYTETNLPEGWNGNGTCYEYDKDSEHWFYVLDDWFNFPPTYNQGRPFDGSGFTTSHYGIWGIVVDDPYSPPVTDNIYWQDYASCGIESEPEPPEYTTDVSVSFFDYMVRILPYYDPSDDKTYLINTTDSVIKYRYNFLDDYTIKVYENSSVIFDKDPFTDFDTDDSGILTIPIEIANSESYTLKVEVYDENDALISFLTDEFDVLGVDDYEIPDETETPNYTGIWGDIQNFVSYIFKWLFVPSTSVINQWKTLNTDIKNHFPASLWYDIIDLFKFDTYEKKTFGSFKAPAGILGPNEVELVSLQPSENMQNSEFWINMKKLMSVAMWFMVIIYIVSKFTDKENL